MRTRGLIAIALALLVAACGVKNDLEIPAGTPQVENENDPSRPPQPLGQ
jgi:hypothetical protein